MHNVLERLKSGRTWDFPGGVHPVDFKTISNTTVIKRPSLPECLYLTVKQHIGLEGQIIVAPGDKVLKGQALTKSSHPLSVPVHAPTSGEVVAIAPHVSAHPSGIAEATLQIKPDGEDKWIDLTPLTNYQSLPKPELIEAICSAGIAGMGGAGFPTHIKVGVQKEVEYLIINGVECEPYITSDDRLMREHAWQIRQGIDVLTHILNPKHIIIAIEDNKPKAIEAMQVACQENRKYLVCSVPTKYPAGGEKQLIQMLLNKEVPSGGLPIDIGVLTHNVGTCYAIADAVFSGKPLIERVITLTGKALNKPGNVWALLGTPMSHLLDFAEYDVKKQKRGQRLIMGGPMMGFSLRSDHVPVVKVSNCLLVPTDSEIPLTEAEQACIRCGACADACPAGLLPQQLYWHSKAKELDKAQDYNLFDCIECGACAYVCPSQIPLVQYYRQAKATIREDEKEQIKAAKAKERFEARQARLEREKEAREEKHRLAAEARKKRAEATPVKDTADLADDSVSESDPKAKVAAALARAKAKKLQSAPSNTESTEQPEKTQKSAAVQAAIARAKAKKEQQAQQTAEAKEEAPSQKSAAVRAAIARAKAKKEAAQQNLEKPTAESNELQSTPSQELEVSEMTAEEKKKARVAAAVAKAKAKKESDQQAKERSDNSVAEEQAHNEPTQEAEASEMSAEKKKKARVAAAVAKAKAKKEAEQQEKESTDNSVGDEQSQSAPTQEAEASEMSAEEKKKARVAAAVAKAKAKKQAERQAAQKNDIDNPEDKELTE